MHLKNRPAFAALVGTSPSHVMTASELARRVHRTPSTIDHLRAGRMSSVTPGLARAIERELGVNEGVLFSHDESKTTLKEAVIA
ncbi:hypothetical protein GCM10009771_06230 [Nesterenkonia flava]